MGTTTSPQGRFFRERELIKVYKTYIRPTIEYSAPIYESMINREQVTQVERLQYFALKNIFGFAYSHRELLDLANIETLEQRRAAAIIKFANKTALNLRFHS